MDRKESIRIAARAAGLALDEERIAALVPAARRLEEAAAKMRELDFGYTEPALVFDVQAAEDAR